MSADMLKHIQINDVKNDNIKVRKWKKIKYKHGKDIFMFAYINFIHNASIIVWISLCKIYCDVL